jgi:hypothetical protein
MEVFTTSSIWVQMSLVAGGIVSLMENSPLKGFVPEDELAELPEEELEELVEVLLELLLELLPMTSPPTEMEVSFWDERKLR